MRLTGPPSRWTIWLWWLGLTLVYLATWLFDTDSGGQRESFPAVARVVGLVVPVGPLTAFSILRDPWVACFVAAAAAFAFVVDRAVRRRGVSGWKFIASCLATLFVATFIADLAWVFTDLRGCFWPSWQIFRGDLRCGSW